MGASDTQGHGVVVRVGGPSAAVEVPAPRSTDRVHTPSRPSPRRRSALPEPAAPEHPAPLERPAPPPASAVRPRASVRWTPLLPVLAGLLLDRGPARPATLHRPIPVVDVELAGTLHTDLPLPAGPASLLLRFRGMPVGCVWVDAGGDPDAAVRDAVDDHLEVPLRRLLVRAGLAEAADATPARLVSLARTAARTGPWPLPDGPLVSVIVCTLGTAPGLADTVRALLAQTYRRIEVVVVDNDPASGRTRAALTGDDPRLRIVDEPLRGLSEARNTGLGAVAGEIVAYTDDDARPDRHWLAELVRVFAHDPDRVVGCVTGLVTTARLDTPWELFFEESGGFGKGYRARSWSLRPLPAALAAQTDEGRRGPLFPYGGGDYGSGNNMAFRTARLRALGGFDPALGAGSPARGGEDLDAFQAVIRSGDAIVYTPTALVRHFHRDSAEALCRQMFGYGTGMAAAVSKQLVSGPAAALAVCRALPASLRVLLAPGSPKNAGKSAQFPFVLTAAELAGYLAGPALLLRGRMRARRRGHRR